MSNGELSFMKFDIRLWITQYGSLINELDNKGNEISLESKSSSDGV
jgi:hypothetical protein